MDGAISKLDVFPHYDGGFVFSWEVFGGFNLRPPWVFHVEEAPSPTGDWRDISGPITDAFVFKEPHRRLINKSAVLYFRVVLDADGKRFHSATIQPYGDLGRKDFLVAREVMRKEVLHMRGMAGVACSLYSLATFGPPCPKCRDPITGDIRFSDCPACRGTGRLNPYNGPYDMWMSFSSDQQHRHQDDGTGTMEQRVFQVRAVANPVIKKNDVIVDRGSDKRYYVNEAAVVAEVRRIPIVQQLVVSEAPVSDNAYRLQ